MAKITQNIRKQIENAIKEKAEPLAEQIAKEAREKLGEKYLNIIEKFYSTYDPFFYDRHFSGRYEYKFLREEGLGRSFSYLYSDRHGDRGYYLGGIRISPDNMHTDYHGTPTQVLLSYLSGWRGLPPYTKKDGTVGGGIESGVHPYYEIFQYREELIQYFNSRLGHK